MKKIFLVLVLMVTIFGISQGATSYTADLSTTSVTIYTGACYIKAIWICNTSTMPSTIDVYNANSVVFTVYIESSSVKGFSIEKDGERIYCKENIKVRDRDTYAEQRVTGQVDIMFAYEKAGKY